VESTEEVNLLFKFGNLKFKKNCCAKAVVSRPNGAVIGSEKNCKLSDNKTEQYKYIHRNNCYFATVMVGYDILEGAYTIQSYRNLPHVLACDDRGELRSSAVMGWAGWLIEHAGNGAYFISSNRHKNQTLACDDRGRVYISTAKKVREGDSGWLIVQAGKNVYFLCSNKNENHVLACSDYGLVCSTPNKVRDGIEGWIIQPFGGEKEQPKTTAGR